MRLIDENTLVKDLSYLYTKNHIPVDMRAKEILTTIMEQPTAYDLDKVVEELEERKEEREKQYKRASMEDGSYMLSKCFSEGARAYCNAIEIVKHGGVGKELD